MTQDPAAFAWNFCPICGDSLRLEADGERPQPHCSRCRRFYYRNPVPAVCCLITRGDSLLLGQRAVEPCLGHWTLPGGFVELGETTEEAAIREIREETTLDISALRLIGVSTQPSRLCGAVTVLGYAVGRWTGEPRPGSDVMDLRFFDRRERPPMPFKAHEELLAAFEALRPAEGRP